MEEYECNHIEADTILFFKYLQIRKLGIMGTVVIEAEDTDVIILSHTNWRVPLPSSVRTKLSVAEIFALNTLLKS